jgi:hypothetical protein
MPKQNAFVLAGVLAACSVSASGLSSGLKPGAEPPAFDVFDVCGPNRGRQLCYRCTYAGAPVLAAFIKKGSPRMADVISGVQKLATQNKARGLLTFVVVMAGPEAKPQIDKIAAARKIKIPVTLLPDGPRAQDVAEYRINPQADNTILMWNRARVRYNFVNVDPAHWPQVAQAAAALPKGR